MDILRDKLAHFGEIVRKINTELPLHSMWDGFWVHSFKRHTLVIACSFDRIYYRNFDIVFKQVIFYNVPESWRDTDIEGDNLIRLATIEEFHSHNPGFHFDPAQHLIFAMDIASCLARPKEPVDGQAPEWEWEWKRHTYFVLAKHVYLNRCEAPDNNPWSDYTDPVEVTSFPCNTNRVTAR